MALDFDILPIRSIGMPNNSLLREALEKSVHDPFPEICSLPSARFLPQLDGVRGLAILAVMITHLMDYVPLFTRSLAWRLFSLGGLLGALGVDLFFVLSGFLITGILVDTRTDPKFFLNFYARRALRIWPLYYSLVFFAFLVVPYFRSDLTVEVAKSYPWQAYVFFLQNFLVSSFGYLILGVTWSVAIEEQFYLFWPVLVRYFRTSNFTIVLLAILCLEPMLRFSLLRLGMADDDAIYTNVFCRLDGLAAGSLLAIYIRSSYFDVARLMRFYRLAILLGVLGFVAAPHSSSLRYSFQALGFMGFIGAAIYSRSIWLQKFLRLQPLRYTGRISYGLYLLHVVAFLGAISFFSRFLLAVPYSAIKQFAFIFIATAAAYLLAAISWLVLERPVLSLKKHFRDPSHTNLDFQSTGESRVLPSRE